MSRPSAYYNRQSYAPSSLPAPRASRALRESMAVVDVVSPLDACVLAANECVQTLGSVVTKLEPGVSDMERLKKVLRAQHHYLVLPAPEVQRRRAEYAAAIEKQLEPLLLRSSQLLDAEAAHLRKLEGRLAELQGAQRAVQPKAAMPASLAASTSTKKGAKEGSALDGIDLRDKEVTIAQRRKIGALRNRRLRLLAEQKRLAGEMAALT